MTRQTLRTVLDTFGAQLGEIAWYDSTFDSRVPSVVEAQSGEMRQAILKYLPNRSKSNLKLLEVGAYQHYSMHLLGDELDCQTVATDISATSLRSGASAAHERGLSSRATLVACDFHDLPFATGYFDFVYIASAVHHTWRTKMVLDELLRVTKPGGVLMLANEPIRRELCFYSFRSNRPEGFTDWERQIDSAKLMYTVSSPFLGSRDEEVFGMIENDRIPWSVFEDFLAGCDVLEQALTPVEHEFEEEILSRSLSAEAVADAIESRLVQLRASRDQVANVLGFSVPEWPEVLSQCRSVASLLKAAQEEKSESQLLARSKLFGAALRTIVRKRSGGASSDTLWRRDVMIQDGVHVEQPYLEGLNVSLDRIELPPISNAASDALQQIFLPSEWMLYQEMSGSWSILNLGSEGTIHLPESESEGILLVRFYAVAHAEGPYRIVAKIDGEEVASADIVRAESRMFPISVPARACDVTLCAVTPDGKARTFTHHFRIAVCRRVPVKITAAAA